MAKKSKNSRAFDQQVFERQAVICKAFANATRLRLLDLLGGGECAVSELQKELDISKANLSQHLAILKSSGAVLTRRDGKQVFCSLAMPQIKQACQLIRNVLRTQVRESRKFDE